MQNAADAAALAGARAMDKVHRSAASANPISAFTIGADVQLVASRNGAQSALVTCTVIGWDEAPLGSCGEPAAVNSTSATGVLVVAGSSRPTTFGRVLGATTLRQERMAAASIQPLAGQEAPLLVCAFGHPSPNILVATSAPGVDPVVYAVNPAAVGSIYLAYAPHVADCGLRGSSFKGVASEGVFVLPGWIEIGTGVQAGPVRSQLAGQAGCGATTLGCVYALPICSDSNGISGSNARLLCDRFGAFELVSQTSNTQSFKLLGGAEAVAGIGGTGVPNVNEVRVIKLIR